MQLIVALAFLLAAAVTGAAAEPVDRSDPAATAAAFLAAFQARDLATVASLMNETNRAVFGEIAARGEAHPRYDSVFSGWRARFADGWDGSLGETRTDGEAALVSFARAGDETIVVVLHDEAAGWSVEDINSPATPGFEALPTGR